MNAKNVQLLTQQIVKAILAELLDRRGIRQVWDDMDQETIAEIRMMLHKRVKCEIDKVNRRDR